MLFTASTLLSAQAQQGSIHVNGGLDFGLPVGDFGEVYGFGYGATAKGLYGISDAGQVGLTLGYQLFGLKSDYDEHLSGSIGLSPIFALYRHSFGGLYVEPLVGLSINKTTLKMSDGDLGSFGFSGSASNTSLGYAAGVGYMFGSIDVSARYQGLSQDGQSLGFIGLRIGYSFGIK